MAGTTVALRSVSTPRLTFAQQAASRQPESRAGAAFLCSSSPIGFVSRSSARQIGKVCRRFQEAATREKISRRSGLSVCRAAAAGAGPGGGSILTPELRTAVDEFLQEHKIVLFMKGNRQFPQCGFSNTCVQILNMIQVPYETVDILENETLRAGMKEYSSWPTFPQIYIDGEFIGGCDIAMEMYQSGELKELVEKALVS